MNKHKTLIIKTGYSEILENRNNSRKVSLGDVLRTTPILHLYKTDLITWVTDLDAFPLLKEDPLIHKLLPYDFTTAIQLQAEEFDTVINFEKIPGICALADRIKAWKKFGFRFDTRTGEAEAYDRAYEVLAVSADPKSKKENSKTTQELLFEMVGAKWRGEEYSLGYKPQGKETYDIALNTHIGQKWPTKAWPIENWDKLEKRLTRDGLRVTRQDELIDGKRVNRFTDLYSYMDWISSAKLIVSNDSLGLHLGIAMKKKVLGLFGPTPDKEVYFYNRGEAIVSTSDCEYLPCFRGECLNGNNCMNLIKYQDVLDKIKKYLV
jgi:heptosyltransferase-2